MTELRGWKLARIHGVDIKVHVSLLLLLPYLVFITAARFGFVVQDAGIDPAAIRLGPFAWGVIMATSLLISVLLHEFGHVLVAQAQGSKVHGVTLMMLGGVSSIDQPSEKRFAEFRL